MKYTKTFFFASIFMGAFVTSPLHAEWTFDQYGQSEIDILINSLGHELYEFDVRHHYHLNAEYEEIILKGIEKLTLLLQQKDAPINHQDYKGKTPLMKAAYFNMHEIMELLIEMGADATLADKKGRNALRYVGLRRSRHGSDGYEDMHDYYTKSRHNACIELLTDKAIKRVWFKRWRANRKPVGLFFYRFPS